MRALGICREIQNSPNREDDDALILRAVMEHLSIIKISCVLVSPEEFDRSDAAGFDLLVPMCEAYPRLMRLERVEAETGVLMVNRPGSVLGCYRTRMLDSFSRTPGLRFPPTAVRRTTPAANAAPPDFEAPDGYWVKRGDVHNTCAYDVVRARDWSGVDAARAEFESREITDMAVQRHVDGDLIKFYGVGPGQWFTWFYHDPAGARRLPFALDDLAEQAALAAAAVGVEVFGGDAIVAPDGGLLVIDINSWPSFARVRGEASAQIARRLRSRLREAAGGKARS